MSILTDYLQKPDAERVMLVTIKRANGDTYCISDVPYRTESVDTPASMQFSPILARNGLPRLHRGVSDPLEGRAGVNYGNMQLAATQAFLFNGSAQAFADLNLFRGNAVTVKITGPRVLFAYADALTVFTGEVGNVSASSAGGMTVELLGVQSTFINTKLLFTTNTDSGANVTITAPRAFGKVFNISPIRPNSSQLKYVWGPIFGQSLSLDAVYDNAVLLAPNQYTVDLVSAAVTLNATPAGTVTLDVTAETGGFPTTGIGTGTQGPVADTLQKIIELVLDYQGFPTMARSFVGLPTSQMGYYALPTEPILLTELFTALCAASGCYWYFARDGTFTVRALPVPAAGTEFDKTRLIGEASYDHEERIVRAVHGLYKKNWTIQTPAAGATNAQKEYVITPGLFTTMNAAGADESTGGLTLELETFFSNSLGLANTKILDLYKNRRRKVKATIPFTSPLLDIGDNITVLEPIRLNLTVLEVDDVFTGEHPTQEIVGIA